MRSAWPALVQFRQFLAVEIVARVFGREPIEQVAGLLPITIAERSYSQKQPGIRPKIMAVLSRKAELFQAVLFVRFSAGHPQNPANRRWFETKKIVLNANGDVGIVVSRIFG